MKIKSIVPPDGGLNKYLPNHLIGDNAWVNCLNMHFGSGFIEKVKGWIKFSTVSLGEAVKSIDNYFKYNGDAFTLFTTNTKICKLDDSTLTFVNLMIPPVWKTVNDYTADAPTTFANFCVPTLANQNGHYYQCTTGGKSGAVEPTWTTGGTVADGTVVWTDKGVYKVLTGTNIKPTFAENVQDMIVFTNYMDILQYWNGTNDMIRELEGTNELESCVGSSNILKAKCMLYTNGFLMLGHTEENGDAYPQRIRWSQYNNVTKWKNEEDGSGQAGWADMTEGVDWIQRILPLSNYVVVYKERSIQVLSYVGGDMIWDKRPAIIGTGLLAPKAIVDLGDEHIFIGPDNIYSFDLIEPKIAGEDIGQYFFKELLNPEFSNRIEGFFIEEDAEAWFTFASVASTDGTPDMAIVYNIDTKKWSIRDMPMTAFGYYTSQVYTTYNTETLTYDEATYAYDSTTKLSNSPVNICGDSSGNIYQFEGTSKDDLDLSGYATTKLFDLDNPTVLKRLMRIQLMVSREQEYDLNVYVGTADNVDEPIVWNGPYSMTLSSSIPPWVDVDLTARYFCLKFETTKKGQPFKLTGYNMWYEERGMM